METRQGRAREEKFKTKTGREHNNTYLCSLNDGKVVVNSEDALILGDVDGTGSDSQQVLDLLPEATKVGHKNLIVVSAVQERNGCG